MVIIDIRAAASPNIQRTAGVCLIYQPNGRNRSAKASTRFAGTRERKRETEREASSVTVAPFFFRSGFVFTLSRERGLPHMRYVHQYLAGRRQRRGRRKPGMMSALVCYILFFDDDCGF
jgi:hypothetical protein